MSDRGSSTTVSGGARYARVSPTPNRGYKVAYMPCPLSDIPEMDLAGNCLAIPMSSIQTSSATSPTSTTTTTNNPTNGNTGKERCSAFSGAATPLPTSATAISLSTLAHDVEAPQPLVDRKPSVSLVRWNNNNNHMSSIRTMTGHRQTSFSGSGPMGLPLFNGTTTALAGTGMTAMATASTHAARQVSFGSGGMGPAGSSSSGPGGARTEPISLATLDRDCFIIPVHSVDRFLPAGIPLPPPPTANADGGSTKALVSPLSVLEVSDPKLCILVHLMSPLEPIDPVLESPLSHPLLKQRAVAAELLSEVQQGNQAVGGMLLANMERSEEFPFIAYYLINTTQTDPNHFYSGLRVSSLSKFEPKSLRYTAAHTLDLYSEVAAICRPPLVLAPNEMGSFKKTQTPATGYIISVFKVFEGDDGERFERNWLYWTGARMLYRYLPRTAGLRRIALHKSTSQKGDKMYLLVCECSDLLKDITSAAVLIPALRARLCGYTGLYRPIQAF